MSVLALVAPLPLALLAVVVARGLSVARREERALVRVTPAPLEAPLAVVIPARNEAARLPDTLHALLREPSAHLSVVVYDDRSSDDTRAIVEGFASRDTRVTLIAGDEPTQVGFGKPLALAAATAHVDEGMSRLLFLDADVHVEPGVLGGLVRALSSSGAVALSGNPRLVCASVVEEALVPAFVALVAAMYRPSRVMRDDDDAAFLNGQLILVERRALDDVGGFFAVRDTVLEDVALARLLKAKGHRLALADLRLHAQTRMYTSWREIAAGFGKNAVALYGGAARTLALGLAALGLGTAPLVSLALALAARDVRALAVVVALSVAVVVMQAMLRARMGQRAWPALVVPLTQTFVAAVLVASALRAAVGGTVEWRGRRYDART